MYQVKLKLLDHELGKDFWESKNVLFKAFFGDFYDFILKHNGKNDLEKKNIKSKEDFYKFADWNADGLDSCYGMGFAFHKYYLDPMDDGKIEEQSENTFLGYCYHNGKYLDFLNFLLSFFPWWRNDEGCTSFNPYNHADDFFSSSWAVLVDTCKLFYFTSETVYHWQSFRVKYALDNIPGTFKCPYSDEISYDEKLVLPKLRVSGYEFLGWYTIDDVKKDEVNKENITLFAKFKRKDTYNYWEKEEKTLVKVRVENYKKPDPA